MNTRRARGNVWRIRKRAIGELVADLGDLLGLEGAPGMGGKVADVPTGFIPSDFRAGFTGGGVAPAGTGQVVVTSTGAILSGAGITSSNVHDLPAGAAKGVQFETSREETYVPPAGCVIARFVLANQSTSYSPGDDPVEQAIPLLSTMDRNKLAAAYAAWHAQFPQAPLPSLFASHVPKLGSPTGGNKILYLVRPSTDWDPILTQYPAIAPTDPRAPAFEAALRFVLPDYVFDRMGTALRGKQPQGSMTVDGPFPYWLKWWSDPMVDFGIAYLKSPGAFGNPAVSHQFDLAKEGLKSALAGGSAFLGAAGKSKDMAKWIAGTAGATAGAAFGGPLGSAAVAAASSFVVDLFNNLFSGPPDPPAWLVTLEQNMKALRGDTGNPPSWGSTIEGLGGMQAGIIHCHRAFLHPPTDGKYDLLTGYARVIAGVKGGGFPLWGWLALAGAGIYAATGD